MSLSILWLGRTLPTPLNAGDRIYSAHLAGAVARAGAQVVFLGLENIDEPMRDIADLDPQVKWRLVPGAPRSRSRSLFSSLPMVGARFATGQYRNAIARELALNVYDAVVFDQYGLSWAVAEVQRLSRNRPIMVHVSHDFETKVTDQIARHFAGDPLRKFLLRENARRTRMAEQHLARSCNFLVALTEHDSAAFVEINPALRCIVLPPGYAGTKQQTRILDRAIPRRAIMVGSFNWIAKQINLERFLEVADTPFARDHIELHIVGIVPAPLLSRLQQRFPRVVFRGFVEDLTAEFRNARLAIVAEEIGGGFKLKILDYIFSHMPIGAVEAALAGVPAQLKSQFLVEPDIRTLVAAIASTIDDIERLNKMHDRAYDLAESLFSWDSNGHRFLKALLSTWDDPLSALQPADGSPCQASERANSL